MQDDLDQEFDEGDLRRMSPGIEKPGQGRGPSKKGAPKAVDLNAAQSGTFFENAVKDDAIVNMKQLLPEEVSMEEEVRQSEMESRLRRMMTDLLKPSIVKVTRLQTDHEMMIAKFQEMIDSHQQVLNAQKEAEEHSEMIDVFKAKLSQFWQFSNQLEDKINGYQKSAVHRMEELEHATELNKSTSVRLGRTLDRSLEDIERINNNIKTMQASLERGIQKNRERMDTEVKQLHIMLGDVRELHIKLEAEVWGPEDFTDISPPSLRKLDSQMKKQTHLLAEALSDISVLQKLDGELMEVVKRAAITEAQVGELQATTRQLGQRVEICAQEAKADFQQASNLMAAFSANLVREARTSFKDELKHAQSMQQDVDNFVRATQDSLAESDTFMKSMGRQLEAMVRDVRIDLESCDQRRSLDKRSLEEKLRQVQSTAVSAVDSSETLLKGLDHMSGVISMSLQSEKMSVALDLQDFCERKETPYVGLRESRVETLRLRNKRATNGVRQPGVDVEALHRLVYQPNQVCYQGTSFERQKLLTLRENLVNIAQEVLQQGPDLKKHIHVDTAAPDLLAQIDSGAKSAEYGPRREILARPGSRGQPGARGSPGPEGRPESRQRERHRTPDGDGSSSRSSLAEAAASRHCKQSNLVPKYGSHLPIS